MHPPHRTPTTNPGASSGARSGPAAAGAIGADDITSKPEGPLDWIGRGFVARGNLTLLTGQGKAGETTSLSALLGLRVAGGALGGPGGDRQEAATVEG